MKINKLIVLAAATALLSGCDDKQKTSGFVRMATLHAIEVESVSMIAEEKGNEKILLRIPCTAWLGVDLDKVEYEENQSGGLVITLPSVEVSSPKVNHEQERVLDERQSVWSSRNTAQSLKEQAERKAQAEVVEIAMSPDAVKLAKAQTRRLIECFYKQCDPSREVVIKWKTSEER